MNSAIEAMAVGEVIEFAYCAMCRQPYPWDELTGNHPPYGQGICEGCQGAKEKMEKEQWLATELIVRI